ncbi:MAG: universal stress protein [Flavisolibacter sp.]|jgi:nucleotide-binding universal stress UspA family protein|nr:universal stress protein [Flavisolibacter sp.]
MKNILVPTDFSDNALKATMYGCEIALKRGAKVHLLHAAEMGHEAFYQPVSMYEKYNNLVLDENKERINTLRSLLQKNYPGCSFITTIDAQAGVAAAVIKYSTEKDIDLVVMGTQGASGIKAVVMGSVATSVMSASKVPVLAIPTDHVPDAPQNILLATNSFEKDLTLTNPLMNLVKLLGCTLHVVVFIDKANADAADYVGNMAKMEQYKTFLHQHYPRLSIVSHVIEGESLEDSIELYSLRNNIGMIALISHKKSFLERLFQQSVTRKMAFHSKIPILSIPAVVVSE